MPRKLIAAATGAVILAVATASCSGGHNMNDMQPSQSAPSSGGTSTTHNMGNMKPGDTMSNK